MLFIKELKINLDNQIRVNCFHNNKEVEIIKEDNLLRTNVNSNLIMRELNPKLNPDRRTPVVKIASASEQVITDKLELSSEAVSLFDGEIKPEETEAKDKIKDNKISAFINDEVEDSKTTEARRKLYAMRISQRIAKGDVVPFNDHRFLAEYDPSLYKASLKASLTAKNDDPETHESLADELLEIENKTRNPSNRELENDDDSIVEDTISNEGEASSHEDKY